MSKSRVIWFPLSPLVVWSNNDTSMSTPAYPRREEGPSSRSAMLIRAGRLCSGQDLVQSAACHQVPLRPSLSSCCGHANRVHLSIRSDVCRWLYTVLVSSFIPQAWFHISAVWRCARFCPRSNIVATNHKGLQILYWCQHIRKIGDFEPYPYYKARFFWVTGFKSCWLQWWCDQGSTGSKICRHWAANLWWICNATIRLAANNIRRAPLLTLESQLRTKAVFPKREMTIERHLCMNFGDQPLDILDACCPRGHRCSNSWRSWPFLPARFGKGSCVRLKRIVWCLGLTQSSQSRQKLSLVAEKVGHHVLLEHISTHARTHTHTHTCVRTVFWQCWQAWLGFHQRLQHGQGVSSESILPKLLEDFCILTEGLTESWPAITSWPIDDHWFIPFSENGGEKSFHLMVNRFFDVTALFSQWSFISGDIQCYTAQRHDMTPSSPSPTKTNIGPWMWSWPSQLWRWVSSHLVALVLHFWYRVLYVYDNSYIHMYRYTIYTYVWFGTYAAHAYDRYLHT